MTSRLLLRTRVLTVAAPSYLARHGRPSHPDDLREHDCLQFIDPRTSKPFDWEFHRGHEMRIVDTQGPLTTTDPDLMLRACVAGDGVAQVLALGVESLLASGELVELFPDWPGKPIRCTLCGPPAGWHRRRSRRLWISVTRSAPLLACSAASGHFPHFGILR